MKKQTLILVLIGVILFMAGSAIAYASVQGAKKNTTSSPTQAPVNISAVVAKSDIPAGTTGPGDDLEQARGTLADSEQVVLSRPTSRRCRLLPTRSSRRRSRRGRP